MALLLHIDTATEYGAVAISNNETVIAVQENDNQKEHASFLHPAINIITKNTGISLNQIDAISVTTGPGSYTGLRVGLTAAKGLCYVLQKPLVAVNTLQAMALAAIEATRHINFIKPVLFAPMIDARRMEVFTGLYTRIGTIYNTAQAMILTPDIFAEEVQAYSIVFSGNGSKKLQTIINNNEFVFTDIMYNIKQVAIIAYQHFINKIFEDIAYCEPYYLKPFYTTAIVKK